MSSVPWVTTDEHLRADIGQYERGTIVNDTGLPDPVIEDAVTDYFVEHSSMAWGRGTTFQTYAQQGSLLARSQYRTPANVVDEIKLARDLAERDDDIGATLGQMLAVAFEEGMENHHKDEKTVALFNELCKDANFDLVFMEMYRELLISGQINSALLFTREQIEYTLSDVKRILNVSLAAPLLGLLSAEAIRVIGNDMFRTGVLAYEPENDHIRRWLDAYFSADTPPEVKAKMAREDRVSANLFTGVVTLTAEQMMDPNELPCVGGKLYILNPRMVKRTTFPKGTWKYPRPLLTRDFSLLEAKRLLNIMDYALLQGGSSFIVVAKKGSDQRPAHPAEIENLQQVVRKASKSGVIVGDHRLTFDIITPKLDEMLNPKKRRLIGRKMSMAMLRLSEHGGEQEGGSEGVKSDDEMLARVISADRRLVKRHVEAHAYEEVVKRNAKVFNQGAPSIWFPKIVLQGTQVFTDMILKLRDRGDIPRRWAVEAAGFPYEAAVEERRREKKRGDDDVLTPGAVPHSSPEAGPQDNNTGRPKGSKTGGGGQDPAAPKKTVTQTRGETIKAWYEEEIDEVVRMGEITYDILDAFPDRSVGRITTAEREVLEDVVSGEEVAVRRASTIMVPVNSGYETSDHKAVRLKEGLSIIVGKCAGNDAFVGRLLCFREPDYSQEQAEEHALRWGYPVEMPDDSPKVTLPSGEQVPEWALGLASAMVGSQAAAPNINIEVSQGGKRVLLRDEDGNIIGSADAPPEG